MDQMPAQLFIGQIFSDVPQRSTIPYHSDCDAPLDVALSGRVPTYQTVNSLYGLILSFISSIFFAQ